jgi:S1-C subfamily serine protease
VPDSGVFGAADDLPAWAHEFGAKASGEMKTAQQTTAQAATPMGGNFQASLTEPVKIRRAREEFRGLIAFRFQFRIVKLRKRAKFPFHSINFMCRLIRNYSSAIDLNQVLPVRRPCRIPWRGQAAAVFASWNFALAWTNPHRLKNPGDDSSFAARDRNILWRAICRIQFIVAESISHTGSEACAARMARHVPSRSADVCALHDDASCVWRFLNMSTELIDLSNALARETDRAAASIVAVHTEARGSSSGVVWRNGIIVTAEHALRRDEEIHVTLPDGHAVPATLAGRDASTDLAVLRCTQAASPLAEFSDASTIKPGSLALVVGRTRASGPVAALGAISLVANERRTWIGASLSPYVRLDVGLQPTAIGGAVIDASGRAIGIATPRFARFGAIAVTVPTVNRVADALLKGGHIPRGYLGVGLHPIRLPEALRQTLQRDEKTAAMVVEVEPDGPAHKAGIMIGDLLIAFGPQPIARVEDVHAQIASAAIGKPVVVKLVRGGDARETTIVPGERPHGGK